MAEADPLAHWELARGERSGLVSHAGANLRRVDVEESNPLLHAADRRHDGVAVDDPHNGAVAGQRRCRSGRNKVRHNRQHENGDGAQRQARDRSERS